MDMKQRNQEAKDSSEQVWQDQALIMTNTDSVCIMY